jgi:uncharacterized protein (DUF2252 family)
MAAVEPLTLLDALRADNDGRKPGRVRRKFRAMSSDAFTFFRGADGLFARAWPELAPADPGPAVVISGDLHLENFGVYRDDEDGLCFDVTDFDEAVVAPCAVDLVRCTTSLMLAGQEWRLAPLTINTIALTFLDRYRDGVATAARLGAGPDSTPESLADLPGVALPRARDELVKRLTRSDGKRDRSFRTGMVKFPWLGKGRRKTVRDALTERWPLPEDEPVTVADVVAHIAGLGSLGVRRYAALVHTESKGWRLFDVKEAVPSALAGLAARPVPGAKAGEAARVVTAQRHLQERPAAGLGILTIGDRPFRIRELIPDEQRWRLRRLRRRPARLLRAVEAMGERVGRMQWRGSKTEAFDRRKGLLRWAAGPAVDALLAAAVRYAQQVERDYAEFRREYTAAQ